VFNIYTDDVAWSLVGNYTARMSVKTSYLVTETAISLTTTNGRIAFAANGQVTLTISATDTAALTPNRYSYDLEFVSTAGTVTRILEGKFVVRPEVTA
jgi:tRNA threonylcarbamoyladenosine modification (KEOPS) complex  Pcc1 subunit